MISILTFASLLHTLSIHILYILTTTLHLIIVIIGNQGTLQATGYIIRFFGGVVGAALGACLYNQDEWGWGVPIWGIFVINAAVPAVVITPFIPTLVEVTLEDPPPLKEQVWSIWELVQQKAVWMPCSFIYLYNVLLLVNPAWNSFLVAGLGFSNFDIGLLTLAGALLSYVALIVYKKYLFDVSWRKIYIFTAAVSFVFSCLQLVLVLQSNQIQPIAVQLLFAMGSYGVVMFVQAIQFLPVCRMFLGMCPDGAEGASYAMLTTLSNLAGTVAYSIAAALSTIWDVRISTLEAGNYDGMWKLTLLCGCIQLGMYTFFLSLTMSSVMMSILTQSLLSTSFYSYILHLFLPSPSLAIPLSTSPIATVGIFFVGLMPSGVVEQLEILKSSTPSVEAGGTFMAVIALSLVYVIFYTISSIVNPALLDPSASDDGGSD